MNGWHGNSGDEGSIRPTYWAVARRLGASPKAVKRRLDEMSKTGALKRIRVIPDSALFGLSKTGYTVMLNTASVVRLKEKARLLPFLESAYIVRAFETPGEFSGLDRPVDAAFAELDILHRNDQELNQNVELLNAVVGELTFAFSSGYVSSARYVPGRNALSVMKAFARDALAPISEMAKQTDLSEKTVSTHLRELAANNAFIIQPAYDYTKLGTLIMATGLLVDREERRDTVEKVKSMLGERWLEENVGSEVLVGITFMADNFSEAQSLYESVRKELTNASVVLTLYPEYLDNQANTVYMKAQSSV
jgi:DNA-binding Lrp family transcriptional regulator